MVVVLTTDVLVRRISEEMVDEISRDAVEHKILTEDDLQFRVYSFIRGVIDEEETLSDGEVQRKYSGNWRAFNKPYLKDAKKFPDLMVVNGKFAKIIIELKHEPARGVKAGDIEEDITKVKGMIDSFEGMERGLVVATIWDPMGETSERLREFQEANGHQRSALILIEVSRNVDIGEHDSWFTEQVEMLQSVRGYRYG